MVIFRPFRDLLPDVFITKEIIILSKNLTRKVSRFMCACAVIYCA